ncbi:zinc transporter ZntB [Pseudomonas sp. LS44]|uniref:zinc transporter ZntB n=1 Tax=Pseudomonas sp. LS44 TaxID=1357074 RepID=UPI00215A4994|nr:zinc transporter ZntB [Pseudomonas sp. LS44]UVE19393.1 zinc transporter ZntB [Pseudomonas sp. LS44]
MLEEDNSQWGLVHAFVLDGEGGATSISRQQLDSLKLDAGQSVWLHWDRGHPQTHAWLRSSSGLNEFSCDLLLEENTRPRLLPLANEELLLFLRGVNLNPGAEPEDMVSVRIFAAPQQVISLRLRPLLATDQLIDELGRGVGPKTASELLFYLAHHLSDKVDDVVTALSEQIDGEEEKIDADERYAPDHGLMLHIRRRAAGLRRFLAPQRDVYAQLSRNPLPWFTPENVGYWNELSNRLIRNLEELELIRERVGLVLESEHRRASERMNRTMYRFGIITGFFLPMSFLTGLLGINVGGIPGSESPVGFLGACLIIGSLAFGQWWLFRRLRWI